MNVIRLLAMAAMPLMALTAASADDIRAGDLSIDDAWSRPAPVEGATGVVYLEIENKGKEPDRLVAAKTPVAENTELHESTEEAGVAKMRPLADGIKVPPNSEIKLKPRGMHIMLLGLKQKLEEGQSFPMTLTFEKQGDVGIEVEVKSGGKAGASEHSKH